MNKLLWVLIYSLTLTCFIGCQRSPLKERVLITDGVSVLMPSEYKKNDMGGGNVLIRSKVNDYDLRVVAIKDTSIDNLSLDKLREGLEVNVAEFLKPMQGKLLQRKDTIMGKMVISDFEFELGDANSLKHGKGKFILKGDNFITFLLVAPVKNSNSKSSLEKEFFDSIKND